MLEIPQSGSTGIFQKYGHFHELPGDLEVPKMASVQSAKKWQETDNGIGSVQPLWSSFFISSGQCCGLGHGRWALPNGWPGHLAFFIAWPPMVFWYWLVAGFLVITALVSWLILVAGFLVMALVPMGLLGLDVLWWTPAGMESCHGAWQFWQHGSLYSFHSQTQLWLHLWHIMAIDGPGGCMGMDSVPFVAAPGGDFMAALFMVFVVAPAFMAFVVFMATPFMVLAFMLLALAAGLDIFAMASALGLE